MTAACPGPDRERIHVSVKKKDHRTSECCLRRTNANIDTFARACGVSLALNEQETCRLCGERKAAAHVCLLTNVQRYFSLQTGGEAGVVTGWLRNSTVCSCSTCFFLSLIMFATRAMSLLAHVTCSRLHKLAEAAQRG